MSHSGSSGGGAATSRKIPPGPVDRIRETRSWFLHGKSGKAVTINGATKVIINGPSGIELTGPLKFTGDITHTGNMTTSGIHTDANGLHK